ncbi:hypothetical protein [Silvanigrella aquatica]|uniref:Type II secretion system protein GspE N-terminal domain-containing protein n=1 Tax=Silvanigrella aquatica TaxID=1915309 RepID=A0A1L4CZN5_9BACT|nr:hypothetical protein [Silvanigrella aquatica]APJ03411.1 hypothetical protein AXG55_05620 [Silvanigrella aquatica]
MYDLLQVMQQDGYLSSGELIALRKTCKELGENPVRVLRSLNIASPEQIQEYLQRYFRVNALGDQAIKLLDEGYQTYIPIDLAIHYSCFGLGEEHSALYVAMEDPSDRGTVQQLRFFLNKRIIAIAANVYQLAEGLSKIYRVSIPNLRLTTVIERSRGVVGGIRYEVPPPVKAHTLNNSNAGASLSADNISDVDAFVATTPESKLGKKTRKTEKVKEVLPDLEPSAEITKPDFSAIPNAPAVGFIDGSSGEVEQGTLEAQPPQSPPSEEGIAAAETPVAEESASDDNLISEEEPSVSEDPPVEAAQAQEDVLISEEEPVVGEVAATSPEEAPQEPSAEEGLIEEEVSVESGAGEEQITNEGHIAEESNEGEILESQEIDSQMSLEENNNSSDYQKEMGENEIAQLSALASSALVKVSMMQEKNQALELVNSLLGPFQYSVTLADDNSYQIQGENFSAKGDLTTQFKGNENPVFTAIDPVLKRILKMSV